jgi:hypothetical protein
MTLPVIWQAQFVKRRQGRPGKEFAGLREVFATGETVSRYPDVPGVFFMQFKNSVYICTVFLTETND